MHRMKIYGAILAILAVICLIAWAVDNRRVRERDVFLLLELKRIVEKADSGNIKAKRYLESTKDILPFIKDESIRNQMELAVKDFEVTNP